MKNRERVQKMMGRRIIFIGVLFFVLGVSLFTRAAFLQIWPQKRLALLKEKLFRTTLKVQSRRGTIYDRYGKELAISISSQSLYADPYLIKKPYFAAKKLSLLFKVPKKKILRGLLNKKKRFVWLKRHLSEKEVQTVRSWKLQGLYFLKEPKRFYTKGKSLSQILGFTGIDGQGLEGIEKQYEEFLQGKEQRLLLKRDARGRPLFADFTPFIKPVSGFDIYLTIDSDLQFYLEKELFQAMEKSKAQSAMGVILSVETAEVLAMANVPLYNPNDPSFKDPKIRRNRVVSDIFEPGSTLKVFTLISALKKGISPSKVYPSHQGKLEIGGEIITESDTKKTFSKFLNMSEILSLSSNVGAAVMALDIGSSRLRKTLSDFGFGEKTGIDFPGETKGLLRSLPWKPVETATISFGHGVAGSALQIANAYVAIANGGFLRKPFLVKKISSSYGGGKWFFREEKIRQVLTEEEARIITAMLIDVTEEHGTGFQAVVPGYLTAGKTGTAQKVDFKAGGYKKGEYISSFTGFIPAHNPKFVIYVVIDGAKDNFYASSLAAPVFSRIASYAVRRAGLSPVLFQKKDFLVRPSEKRKNFQVERRLASMVDQVPDLKGLTLREALQILQGKGLKLKISGSHQVIRSIPLAGEPLPPDKKLSLFLN